MSRLTRGAQRLWYEAVRTSSLLYFSVRGGIRFSGRENIPARGGALLVSNHVSHLDVFALGASVPRPLRYVTRSSLFKPVLGALIRSVGGFPLDREGGGIGGLKETMRLLKGGQLVLLFPEGTRSPDGSLQELKPGVAALARCGVPFIPVGLAGTFEALPKGRSLPSAGAVWLHFGVPVEPAKIRAMTPEQIVDRIRVEILHCQAVAQEHMTRMERKLPIE